MTQLAEQLDKKLATWNPEIAAQVEQLVSDVIAMADANALDLLPSRPVVQKVLDLPSVALSSSSRAMIRRLLVRCWPMSRSLRNIEALAMKPPRTSPVSRSALSD